MIIGFVTMWLYAAFGLVGLILQLWALADCLRHRSDSFLRADKRTKTFWGGVTGGSAAVGLFALPAPLGPDFAPFIFGLAATIAACVYLADVKPALQDAKGSRGRGPYGPW